MTREWRKQEGGWRKQEGVQETESDSMYPCLIIETVKHYLLEGYCEKIILDSQVCGFVQCKWIIYTGT